MVSPESSSTLAATSFCAAAIEACDLLGDERRDLAKGIDAGDKTNLRLEDIADAGQHFLMEQHIGDFFVAMRQHAAQRLRRRRIGD